jgi:formylglycine-generating enzyme required for sulfatase activity
MKTVFAITAVLLLPLGADAVTINTVLVGNPGNASDLQPQGLFGSVATSYRIGTTEVTNAQYVEFLNAVAAADPYGLYDLFMGFSTRGGITRSGSSGSYIYAVKSPAAGQGPGGTDYTYGDKPVVYVTWYDAVRFANWLHNGQGSGSTESGAYTLLGGTPTPSNADSITRSAAAKWFLTSENEWYKAAYYNAAADVYYDYPIATDTPPDNNLPSADTGNSANYLIGSNTSTGNLDYPHTTAGGYGFSDSPYGTFDQGGNVWEWNQSLLAAGMRGRRGGAWSTEAPTLAAANQGSYGASLATDNIGFRVASVPDPDALAGDFNGDGNVDAADYVTWRKTAGTQDQYNAWRANFGMSSPGAGSASHLANVPEPALWLLGAAGVLWYVSLCRRLAGRNSA